MYFFDKTRRKQLFLIISVLIPVNEFRSVQTCRSLRDVISARIWVHCTRLFVRLRLRVNGARDNANVTRRSHYQKSLLRDNDRAVFCAKLETIYVDWIALLRRLLMTNNYSNILPLLECILDYSFKLTLNHQGPYNSKMNRQVSLYICNECVYNPRNFCFYSFSASVSFDFETRIMLTCMSTSRSNYFNMSIWKKHADHSTNQQWYPTTVSSENFTILDQKQLK